MLFTFEINFCAQAEAMGKALQEQLQHALASKQDSDANLAAANLAGTQLQRRLQQVENDQCEAMIRVEELQAELSSVRSSQVCTKLDASISDLPCPSLCHSKSWLRLI